MKSIRDIESLTSPVQHTMRKSRSRSYLTNATHHERAKASLIFPMQHTMRESQGQGLTSPRQYTMREPRSIGNIGRPELSRRMGVTRFLLWLNRDFLLDFVVGLDTSTVNVLLIFIFFIFFFIFRRHI